MRFGERCSAWACQRPFMCLVRCAWVVQFGDVLLLNKYGSGPMIRVQLCAGHEHDIATGENVRLSPSCVVKLR